ncbi:NACHT domain-containing protein [Phytohabitans kaempferiae]|uniref:NACHT domain-containing protein n=1 Tax=Phytohabitans kaempferiae TaxID=1620943 RepID=A0ABV6MGB1_9ACTN
MPQVLSYADAVRLLGGRDSRVVAALESLTSGALLGAAVPFPVVLGWFDAKSELARLGHQLVRGLAERRGGLSRYGRTQRLEAAHAVLVVTAYFEALAEADLPIAVADLELTGEEQLAVAGGGGVGTGLPEAIFALAPLLPGPQEPHDRLLETLREHYRGVSTGLARFVGGLAVWERLPETARNSFRRTLEALPPAACARYAELFRQLGADFPEVAFWSGLREHAATRAELRGLGVALTGLGRVLDGISTGRVPDERRAALARANEAALDRPIVEAGDVPPGLRVPALGEAYVTPLYRVARAGGRISDETWWSDVEVRDDLQEFLAAFLTSPRAVEAPLLVLGQPGSGKSVLTKVLAARLPAADFLPVRVVLRDVPAAADLQDQIEYAIRAETGERLDWPALARSAGDALPVVVLDGFDELLQATGVSQSDYLGRVAAFQRREADQGRPVVVVVTSRTSVADRARAPEGTVAVWLEPFDEPRIAAWLRVWHRVNAGHLAARGLAPLTPAAVLPHRELAGQPLLLLMLALYDADGNALQRLSTGLDQDELYERLLRSFARREVTRHRPGLPERDLDRAVEEELRRLSLVAFAMFNRNTQWVTEADLGADLAALTGDPPPPAAGLRAPLGRAEIVLGRFFFVHRARAVRDGSQLGTYEFLHATFGEFLVARMAFQALRDLAARDAAATLSFGAAPADDDLLHALLSFSVLSVRTPIAGFLRGMLSRLDAPERAALAGLLVRLLRRVHHAPAPRRLAAYQPRTLPVPARYAAYSANLTLLAVHAAGTLRVSEIVDEEAVAGWKRQSMLWRSQLHWDEWQSLVELLTLERVWVGDARDIVLGVDDGTFRTPPVDLYWTYEIPPSDPRRGTLTLAVSRDNEYLRRRTNFLCRTSDDAAVHSLEPLERSLPAASRTMADREGLPLRSVAHALLEVWLLKADGATAEERERALRHFTELVRRTPGLEGWERMVEP